MAISPRVARENPQPTEDMHHADLPSLFQVVIFLNSSPDDPVDSLV
jgi:hypothetical protein